MESPRTYLIVISGLAGAVLTAIAVANYVADPFGSYEPETPGALAMYKEERGSRSGKAEIIRNRNCETVMLGSSRTDLGFDPESPAFEGAPVCNAALQGTNFYETHKVFLYSLANAPELERVILFVDFGTFSAQRQVGQDFDKSRFNTDKFMLDYHLDNVVSLRATESSWDVIQRYRKGEESAYTPLGLRRFISANLATPTRRLFEANIKHMLTNRETYADFVYSEERVDLFREIVRTCVDRGIELIVAVPPAHALQMEATYAAGLWEQCDRWKHDLTMIVHEIGHGNVPIWDFTDFNEWTSEPLPEGDEPDAMRWHWEASHIKRELGDLVLKVILERADAPAGLGVRMTPENVAQHLATVRAQRDAWAAQNPDLVEWVATIKTNAKVPRG